MSIVHIRHITKSFDKEFLPLVDMADYQGKQQAQVDDAFHTRAQAAYSLVVIAKLEPKAAAASITDAYDDNGIDALYYDQDEKTLYLVQSKWHKTGQGSIESADVMKFVQGVRDLLEANFARFNTKIVNQQTGYEQPLQERDKVQDANRENAY